MASRVKRIDAEGILKKLAELRKSVPYIDKLPPRKNAPEGRTTLLDEAAIKDLEDFDYLAVADGLRSLADDIQAAIDQAHANALEKALEIYYTAEELARDPAHADLIPHVEAMRKAYEHQYGGPIPPKGTPPPANTKRQRRR